MGYGQVNRAFDGDFYSREHLILRSVHSYNFLAFWEQVKLIPFHSTLVISRQSE